MKKKYFVGTLVLSLVGLVFGVVAAHESFQVAKLGMGADSYCNINSFINCDLVQASSYAKFLGVPVSVWGVFYYGWLAITLIFAKSKKEEGLPIVGFAWLASFFALLYTAYMAWVSLTVLEVLCLNCLGMYVVNILLFLVLGLAYRSFKFGAVWRSAAVPVVTAVLIFGLGGLVFSQQSNSSQKISSKDLETITQIHFRQSEYDLPPPEGRPFWGDKDAKVVLVEFSDFRCPYCKIAADTIKPALYEFRKQIKFYYLNYPIDATCNHNIPQGGHEHSCLAAEAGICANKKGDFWNFHYELFAKQKEISPETIDALIAQHGWDLDSFHQCMNAPETQKMLQEDIALGQKLNIGGTPSLFIDARRVKYWAYPEALRSIVSQSIKNKR